MPLPGRTIPYELMGAERQEFIQRNAAALESFFETRRPVYGVIVREAYGQVLVWFDASNALRVVDVTNMPIVREIAKPEWQSPDSSIIGNMLEELESRLSGAWGAVPWVICGLIAWELLRK